jgi:hypothetical protein
MTSVVQHCFWSFFFCDLDTNSPNQSYCGTRNSHCYSSKIFCLLTIMLAPGAVAIIAGLLAHWLVFIHGEWHLKAPPVVVVHVLLGCLLYVNHLFGRGSLRTSLFQTIYLATCYLSALFTSIAVYRLIFHRLKHFPGPKLAALSKLWHVWKCRDSRGHLVLQAWHEKYGEFVRTGKKHHNPSSDAG